MFEGEKGEIMVVGKDLSKEKVFTETSGCGNKRWTHWNIMFRCFQMP
jgi:hypothetical protein